MNSEDKIVEMLGTLTEKVEKHGEILGTLTEKIENLDKRMDSLEAKAEVIDARSVQTAVLLETEVAHKINLLYEGHETIMDKLDDLTSTKSRVEMLEADMTMMKDAYKLLRQEVNELKKAQ